MNSHGFLPLDNPAWFALNGPQRSFAEGSRLVKRYRRGILPFAAFDPALNEVEALNEFLRPGEIFFLIGTLPELPADWSLLNELTCRQMVQAAPLILPGKEDAISPLGETHKMIMYDLIQRVQPGYYEPGTHELGQYFGIWDKEKLVAIAGERMRLDDLTEISAVCTDPDYTGRKYAQQLVAHLCNMNHEMGITPFLHVLTTNERAIRLYEYMGFTTRRIISFWKLMKNG